MTGHSDKLVASNLIYDTKVNPTHVTYKPVRLLRAVSPAMDFFYPIAT